VSFKVVFDGAVYVAVRAVIAVVQALPLSTCERLAYRSAFLLYDVLRLRRGVIDDNLRLAYPHLSQAARRGIALGMWRHLLLMVAEVAQAPRKIHVTNWREHSYFPQVQLLVRLLLAERPLVALSGHFGNFEMAGYMLGLFGFPSHSIARPLDNPLLDRFITRFRGRTGQRMLPKDGSGVEIAQVLRHNGIVGLLGDQAAGRKGCWVRFFGRAASTHKAVAVLSLGSGAPMLVSYARRLDRPLRYEMGVEGVADPAEPGFAYGSVPLLAQWYTDRLEGIINRSPEQYWWVHRRWKGTPPAGHLSNGEVAACNQSLQQV
jgi:KDO2-lipid IV(A) lauroyltransferase